MDKEPIEAQNVEHWTIDQLFERSLEAMHKRLGVSPLVVEADKPKPEARQDHVTDVSESIKDVEEDNG